MRTRLATLALAITAQLASAQATVAPLERASNDDRPAPAAERVAPNLDAWWQDAVFYEVFVRSFADSTTGPLANDGIGDLRGLMERLDYLNDGDPATTDDLGVTALWLMPVAESPSYHGYDTTDYRKIEPDYGTNADFLALMDACRARGIRVIVDLVLNHCSSRHPWFQAAAAGDPAKRDWFIWRDEHPGWRGPWNQPVWHASPREEGSFYYGIFWAGMPDLDYRNSEVSREMLDVTRFWLEDLRADGFRLDAIRHLIEDDQVQDNTPATHDWLKGFYQHVKSINPDALTVGEVWAGSDDVSRYVGNQMDIAFEFDLAYAIVDAVRDQDASRVAEQMERIDALYPLGAYATFLRNHDQPRTLHELGGNRAAAKLAAAIHFALPGVPFIYYGEEIGMSADKPDPQLRTPMQWAAGPGTGFTSATPWIEPKPDTDTVNVASERRNPFSMLNHYKRLIEARTSHDALRTGAFQPLDLGDPRVLAFLRVAPTPESSTVLCLFNLSDEPVEVQSLTTEGRIADGDLLEIDIISGADAQAVAQPLTLPPRSARYHPITAR